MTASRISTNKTMTTAQAQFGMGASYPLKRQTRAVILLIVAAAVVWAWAESWVRRGLTAAIGSAGWGTA